MSEYILEMRDIIKTFPGVKALKKATLCLHAGKVHALMGENGAGKSTLMNCLFGIHQIEAGEIFLCGKKISVSGPSDALSKGIAMVHQELQLSPTQTVAENIFMGRFPMEKKFGLSFVDHQKMNRDAEAALQKVHLDISPETKISELSVSQMQSVEIAKAVSTGCRVLILDEPTSSLSETETEALFRIIRELRDGGTAVVYISHKMDEILRISDELTVMRDGEVVGTWKTDGLTKDYIIEKMVGRELTALYPEKKHTPGDTLLTVKNFTSTDPKSFRNVSFSLRKGEILGIGGLVGAQRTELVEGIFGLRPHAEGELCLKGKPVRISIPSDAIHAGIALLTEDRRKTGIMGVLSIRENMAVASLEKYTHSGFLNEEEENAVVDGYMKKLKVKAPSADTLIASLSGGNQQKVLIGRWLANAPDILILDEPTRGIDVGAKYEIYTIMEELAAAGKAVLMISSEMSELLGMSDRIMVMCAGRVTGFLSGEEATQENIMRLAAQFETKEEA